MLKQYNNIVKKVEEQLEEKSYKEYLAEEGVFMWDQTFGREAIVYFDPYEGDIKTRTTTPNNYIPNDNSIIIAKIQLLEKNESDICEGADMSTKNIQLVVDSFDIEFDDINDYIFDNQLDWFDIGSQFNISAEDWVEKIMGENWCDWEKNYVEWALEDLQEGIMVDNELKDWQDQLKQYYNEN